MKDGPRAAVDPSALPRRPGSAGAARFATSLLGGEEGASVVVAATDERQAGIVFSTASRMVELDEDLAGRGEVALHFVTAVEALAYATEQIRDLERLAGSSLLVAASDLELPLASGRGALDVHTAACRRRPAGGRLVKPPESVPEVQQLGTAVLVQGVAVADLTYLVRLGLRYRAQVDGAQPSLRHRRLHAALVDAAVSAEPVRTERERGRGHADVPEPVSLPESTLSTAEAAQQLGIVPRQVRRLSDELGGRLVRGAWRYDTAAVHAEAQRRKARR